MEVNNSTQLTMNIIIHYGEAAELAAAILDVEAPETDEAIEAIESQFMEKYDIDLNVLSEIAERLLPLCAMDKSPLTNTFRKGFVRDNCYIVKIETDEP